MAFAPRRCLLVGRLAATAFALVLAPVAADAAGIDLPDNAEQLAQRQGALATFDLPVAPFAADGVQIRSLQGGVTAESWRFPIGSQTTSAVMRSLRNQLTDEGYQVLLECDQARCGGFDFRYRLALFDEPDMHVDLGNFLYLAATRPDPAGPDEYVQLVVSRSPANAYLQITRINEGAPVAEAPVELATKAPEPTQPDAAGGLARDLGETGHAALADLRFETGSAELSVGDYLSLAELALFLDQNPDTNVALVGHTDAVGSLENNTELSRQRAASVVRLLVDEFGIDPTRLEAQGVGYLSPVASNQTEEGRQKNRRVEAVVTSTR